jgi:hypothetical protein
MNDDKINNDVPADNIEVSKEGRKRISYVSKDLKTMIDFVAKVYNNLGHTTYHSNKTIATVHALSPDSIKLQLSSSQQYKLLEIKYGVGYKVTDHFQKIYLPKTEQEKRNAVIDSLKHAETYQQLFKDYEFHVVPFDGVKNHFIRTYGMKEDIASKAAQVFIDNLKDYELLDSRNVLTSAMPNKPIVIDPNSQNDEGKKDGNNGDANDNRDDIPPHQNPPPASINDYAGNSKYLNHIWIPIHITKGQTAIFAYPKEITENDIKVVEHQLSGILLRIRLENEEKKDTYNEGK